MASGEFVLAPRKRFSHLDGADHMTARVNYQMVPLEDWRRAHFKGRGGDFVVSSADPDCAELWDESHKAPIPSNRIILRDNEPFGSETHFTIHGKKAGRTQIIAVDDTAAVAWRIVVSVKNSRDLTYRCFHLMDAKRKFTNTYITNIENKIMVNVEEIYKRQTNVTFWRKTPMEVLYVDFDLGDPLMMVYSRPPLTKNNQALAEFLWSAMVEKNKKTACDLVVLSTWDMEYWKDKKDPKTGEPYDLIGYTWQGHGYVTAEWSLNSDEETTALYTHEIGHSFGLDHRDRGNAYVMTPMNFQTYNLSWEDIDTVNPSGK